MGDASAFDNNTTLNASLVTDDQRSRIVCVWCIVRVLDDGYTEMPLKNQTVGLPLTSTYQADDGRSFAEGGNLLNRPLN